MKPICGFCGDPASEWIPKIELCACRACALRWCRLQIEEIKDEELLAMFDVEVLE